jgi:tRNA G18 (ribose-2'-O)-methylase SpoU
MRLLTRKQRLRFKEHSAEILPINLAAINFRCDGNLGQLIRAAVCFGVENLYVVGHIPTRQELKNMSGSTLDYINIIQCENEEDLLDKIRDTTVLVAELTDDAQNVYDFEFDYSKPTTIIVGNESVGVPGVITTRADNVVYIPMPGYGVCLNTAHTANIMLYEAARQYSRSCQSA